PIMSVSINASVSEIPFAVTTLRPATVAPFQVHLAAVGSRVSSSPRWVLPTILKGRKSGFSTRSPLSGKPWKCSGYTFKVSLSTVSNPALTLTRYPRPDFWQEKHFGTNSYSPSGRESRRNPPMASAMGGRLTVALGSTQRLAFDREPTNFATP